MVLAGVFELKIYSLKNALKLFTKAGNSAL
jgi:hypothetical protein